jgi:LysM domain-containing protein
VYSVYTVLRGDTLFDIARRFSATGQSFRSFPHDKLSSRLLMCTGPALS